MTRYKYAEPTDAQRQIKAEERKSLECAFETQVRQAGLPEPEREVKLNSSSAHRWDFVWPRYRLAVEINGGIWKLGGHSTGRGIQRDQLKLTLATLAGYRSLQFDAGAVNDGTAVMAVQNFILGYREMIECEYREKWSTSFA